MGERTKLVGRGIELAALDTEVLRSAAGAFRCVLLSGDPGVGKTRLAEEVLARSAPAATTLVSRARPLGAAASFGLWAEALEQHGDTAISAKGRNAIQTAIDEFMAATGGTDRVAIVAATPCAAS